MKDMNKMNDMNKNEVLRKIINDLNIDGLLITDHHSLIYYTGFSGEGFAVVTANKNIILTDSRYTEAAQKASDFEVREFNAKKSASEHFVEIVKDENVRKLGFEDQGISYADYMKFEKWCSNEFMDEPIVLRSMGEALYEPRQIKSDEEVELLRQAEHIGDLAFEDVLKVLRPGMTELEVAAELEYSMKRHGAEGFSFETIAASGVNSSMPHAVPTEKKLENGDFLTMDFGCIYKGYCSDMTRTVCIGKASDEQKKVYNIVLSAQLAVLDSVRAGLMCKNVDKIARDYIANQGYGDYFGHGLGHSVGLYIHERPAFNTKDTTILAPNMILTDEPGIYLPGKFGVRIEDMILITADGCEPLAHSPKELIEL